MNGYVASDDKIGNLLTTRRCYGKSTGQKTQNELLDKSGIDPCIDDRDSATAIVSRFHAENRLR